VLIIDDDLEVLTATSILLKKWGCVVMTAKTSDEVLENIDFSEQADFILSDLRLPGELNGIELLDLIRARAGKDIPAIIITGDTGPERILLSQKSSYKILHKPLKPAQLRTTIHIALTNKTVS
jgi:CheY-like chemotaxis protein